MEKDTLSFTSVYSLTSLGEIRFFIFCLRRSKAPGIDQINNILLKNLPALNYLLRIYNFCITNSYVPNALKLAKFIPLPKKEKDEKLPTNYCPVSVLRSLGKLFEKIVHHRFKTFGADNNLFIPISLASEHYSAIPSKIREKFPWGQKVCGKCWRKSIHNAWHSI